MAAAIWGITVLPMMLTTQMSIWTPPVQLAICLWLRYGASWDARWYDANQACVSGTFTGDLTARAACFLRGVCCLQAKVLPELRKLSSRTHCMVQAASSTAVPCNTCI